MKQPEHGGSYIYDPDKDALTKVERLKPGEGFAPQETETPTATQQAISGAARKGK